MSRYQELPLTLLLLVFSVPLAIVAAAILWFQLGPPLIFSQIRAGMNGKTIIVRKFRTMTDRRDADGELLPDDQRQTRITRIIRRLRMDELPQLWSILRGDMSLVGPRPLLPATVASFGSLGELRNSVRPGLTGWAQISGNTRLSNAEKLALDVWYVTHRSFGMDLRILLETAMVPLRGEIRDDDRLQAAMDWVKRRFGNWFEVVA
ncbi:sugar transferase [Paracoccus sediminicola]|uniref:sugar transferase n=1 Tax=Paracoccus sediminicola TaxID=3017783 RepID=UPI0022F08DDC|nr:sugar transferase [Paracoccus sediminicola]WBU56500.1 sugar transferase [Paracoccus sediminicola]